MAFELGPHPNAKAQQMRSQTGFHHLLHELPQLLVLPSALTGFIVGFDFLDELRHSTWMLNRELGQPAPQLPTLRLVSGEQGLFQHVDPNEIEKDGMFLSGESICQAGVVTR